MPLRAFVAFVLLLASLVPAGAQVRDGADALQLMTAAGMSLKGGKVVNPCGRPTDPKVKFIDLDGDGRQEAVSQDRDPACYGVKPGIQSKVLARDRAGRWVAIGTAPGVVKPLGTRAHGWADFTLEGKGCQPVWRFDGQHYLATNCPPAAPPVATVPSKPAAPVAASPVAEPNVAPSKPAVSGATGPGDNLSLFPETYGSFAPNGDCTQLPRATVSAKEIRIETAAGSAAFVKPGLLTNYMGTEDASITYFLQGEGEGLIVSVLRNELWTSDGEHLGTAERALAAVAGKGSLRRCGAQVAEPQPEPQTPPTMRASAATGVDQFADIGAMTDPGFKAAYLKALGPLARTEGWLVDMQGPGEQKIETLAGGRYLLVATCKTHDCGDNAMLVLYRPEAGELFGLVSVKRMKKPLGTVPPALRPELMRLWKAEWPAG
ncbi:inhibitor of vertebrate lysozyme family protein [Ancylobacter sp. Lp-2]|uniref:Ivy family c-type lysozyme inhibitor n=1 Tax=Ancylobacter sp. Lp-2 TaxID=2881339 RepID=UPI001E28E61C|nr:Ivy family c-type lysozyme inhibitor [Ancylobacter sp. Lp-2]MCB4770999.1 inhibitor of vertebrate lysozyme family protein [Ancylobacter sp. Lp-2]